MGYDAVFFFFVFSGWVFRWFFFRVGLGVGLWGVFNSLMFLGSSSLFFYDYEYGVYKLMAMLGFYLEIFLVLYSRFLFLSLVVSLLLLKLVFAGGGGFSWTVVRV